MRLTATVPATTMPATVPGSVSPGSPFVGRRFLMAMVVAMVLAMALVFQLEGRAHATVYEVFIEVETEDDLYDLQADGQIDQDTFDALLELYQRGVNLNSASREELYSLPNLSYHDVDRILAYREEIGWIDDPAALVTAGVLTERKLFAVASFLLVAPRTQPLLAVKGRVNLGLRYTVEDSSVPPMALRARMTTMRHLTLGVAALLTRNRLDDVRYDPNRGALSAEPEAARVHVPKLYAFWETDTVAAIAGTYRIGFGQRLTFDNTSQYTPNGIYLDDEISRDADLARACKQAQGELAVSPCAGAAGDVYNTPDFRWRDALLGAAVGLKSLAVGTGRVQMYGFASRQPQSIYQYEIYDRARCADPTMDNDPACAAPYVYNRGDTDGIASPSPLDPQSRFSFHTLPDMFAETVIGGNLMYSANRRTHIGMTGYRSSVDWLVDGMDLDFQEWSRLPYGGGFGALGVDAAWGRGWADVFVEAAHSFDAMPATATTNGGGGGAAIVRGTATWKQREIEAAFRYYGVDFANPHARPISAADEFDGLRARDEVGLRLRYNGVHMERFNLRAAADVWSQPSGDSVGAGSRALSTLLYVRTDVDAGDFVRWGVWAQYQDKDLSEGGRDQCFEIPTDELEGEPIPCAGQKIQLTGRLRYAINSLYSLSGQMRYEMLDDGRYDDKYRKDVSGSITGLMKPSNELRARIRARYVFEDIEDNQYLEQFVSMYTDLTYRLRKKNLLRMRYDIRFWLDERVNTMARTPSPEHWFWLELESRF